MTELELLRAKVEAIRCDYIAIAASLNTLVRWNQCLPEERQHTSEQRDFLNRMQDYFAEEAEMLQRDGLPEIFQRVNALEEENERLTNLIEEMKDGLPPVTKGRSASQPAPPLG